VIFGTSTSLESYRPTIRVPILKIDVKHLSVDPMRVQSYLKKQLTILTCALKFGSEIQKCIPERALFISNDLATGGAQRSLCNLVAGLSSRRHVALVTLIRPPVDSYVDLVADKLAPLSWDDRVSLSKKFRDILEYVSANRIGTLCFWNVDLRLKLAIGRFAQVFTNLRIIEVSPGPILNKALAKGADEAASMGITAAEYRDRVDAFVVKYPRAEAWEGWEHASALHCIPNGVPIFHDVRNTVGIGQENFRLVCSSRMIPAKFVLELLEGVALVRNNGVAASLTLIGGADSRYQDYWRAILTSANTPVLRGSVKFVGKVNDPRPFLRDADLAVMLSIDQGCPNASLEAMSEGVPVLANNNGGTSEQIIDGVTGFLITSPTAESVAAGILRAFRQFACLSGMGINARGHVREKFSMEAMCASYDKLIWGDTRLSK
jgi:glycosyltransferase involved in cell wall biosynthesis